MEPTPTLEAVGSLVQRARDGGHDVRLDISGEQPGRLPDAVSLAAFRIVQESLTNIQRHAGDAAARISLVYEPDRLRLAIENGPGASTNAAGLGVGIIGMKERAATGRRHAARGARPGRVSRRRRTALPQTPVIRVLLADDQAAVRGGFSALVAAEDEMHVAAEATNGREAVDLARRVFPHVVVMDIRMPVLDGIDATRLICSDPTLTATRVLVLTTFDLDDYVYAALRAGASGFLLKDAGPRDLLNAIRVVAQGGALIAPSVTRRLIAEFAARRDPGQPPAAMNDLTAREREILRLVARGLSNAQIADSLTISPLTAKTHVSRILGKLDCRDRAQLVNLAYETGLVSPGDPD